ncbi:RNA polymerase sigma factor [Streptomyces chrestomyceticus]|uniref:RNA polymerase sigma factor n=1 Tax=Streptomyces chrestomyceticus TaxID=68185 RepID=UPI00368D149A
MTQAGRGTGSPQKHGLRARIPGQRSPLTLAEEVDKLSRSAAYRALVYHVTDGHSLVDREVVRAEAVVQVVRRIEAGHVIEDVAGYLYVTMRHAARAAVRKAVTSREDLFSEVAAKGQGVQFDEVFIRHSEIAEILADVLTPMEHEVLIRVAVQGANAREAAEAMGIKHGAARKALLRARKKLHAPQTVTRLRWEYEKAARGQVKAPDVQQ